MSQRGMMKDGSLSKSPEFKEREAQYVNTQSKAFKNWANYYLKERNLHIENLDKDLTDGVLLINLVEVLTGRSVGKYTHKPKLKVQKINNINLALGAIRSSRATNITASAEEIHDGNSKPLLGLMWTLVHEFQLQASDEETGKSTGPSDALGGLREWLANEIDREPYNLSFNASTIRNDFTSSFKDGKVLSYLVHRARPGLIDLNSVNQGSAADNLKRAMALAEKELNIPVLLEVEDFLQGTDERMLATYVSYFRNLIRNNREVAEIASAVSQTQGRVDDISQKQEKTNQELEENKKKMRELEEMVRKLSADGGDKDKLKDKYQKKIKELEEEISALKQTNRDSDRAHALELESLKNKIESLKDKRDAAAEAAQRQIRDAEDKARSAQQTLIQVEEQYARIKRDNEGVKRRLSDADGALDKQLQASEELLRKLQERDREVEKLTEEKKQLEKRAKAGWDAKQKSDEECAESKKHYKEKKQKLKAAKEALEKDKQELSMQLEKMKLSGGDAAKELKQEKAKRKIAETDLERERSRNAEEKDESLRKVRRLEDRVAELETDVADKDKELKRKLQALDKGTGMAQSLHSELDKVKAKLAEAISEKDAATEAEEIQLRENEKLKVALDEAREKLDREKKRRKTVEIQRSSDKDWEAEVAALQAKIAQLESDKEAQRLKIVKIEGERDELKSKIQKLEHAAEKNEVTAKELAEDKARLEAANQELEAQRAGMVAATATVEGEKERLRKEKEALESKMKEIAEAKRVEEERVNELDKKLVGLEQINDRNNSKIASLEAKVNELEKSEDKMKELAVQVNVLKEENTKNDATITDLEQKLRAKEAADDEVIQDLERKLREKDAAVATEDSELAGQVSALQADKDRLALEVADKDERVKELEKTADDLVKEYEKEKQRADDLEKELEGQREHKDQQDKRSTLRADKDVKRKLKEMQEQKEEVEVKNKELEEKVEELTEAQAKVRVEVDEVKSKLDKAKRKKARMRLELDRERIKARDVERERMQERNAAEAKVLEEELLRAQKQSHEQLSAAEERIQRDTERIRFLESQVQALEHEAEKTKEQLVKLHALEEELTELKRKVEEDKKVKNITKVEQQVQEKSEAVMDELEFELEEEEANAPEDDAINVNKKEDTLTYQELCELRQELELRLDEEQANNNERELRYKKELEKLRQELEMERKEVIRLEVQLDKASAAKEVDVDNVRQQMTEKVEVLKQELKQVKESEKIAESRVRELEGQTEKLQLEKANEVREAKLSRKATNDYRLIMEVEELIRQLYFHRGAAIQFDEIEEEHRENVKFVEIVNDLRKQVDHVIEDTTDNYYRDPIPSAANADNVRDYVLKLRKFREDVKRERNDFARACNKLGTQYENKSVLEQDVTRWKETLLRIVQEEEETITPDNKQLLEDMEEVRRLLRDDDSQRDEVRAYRKDKVFARLNVEKKIDDLRKFIVEELHFNENKRLRDLLMDLKDANRRLQASTFRSVMHQTFYISREQRARIAKVVGLMIQHFRVLFKEHATSTVNEQVHPMVRRPIGYLERRGIRSKDILGAVRVPPANKVQDLKDGFYSGEAMDIPEDTDPYVVGELLKEYFRDLKKPLCTYKRYESFDRVNDMPSAKQLRELRACIDDLPKVRRATLTVLIGFLHKVKALSNVNGMPSEKLAEVFGPLLLRPLQDR